MVCLAARGELPAAGAVSRVVVRAAAALCLALAALLLVVDAREYPGVSLPALRALGRGVLPLIAIAVINLRAAGGGRGWRLLALAANVVLLGAAVRLIGRGAPLFFWMLAVVAVALVIGSVGLLRLGPRATAGAPHTSA